MKPKQFDKYYKDKISFVDPEEILWFINWIKKNVTKPIAGFSNKKNNLGECLDEQEQLECTHFQILEIVMAFLYRGRDAEDILKFIVQFKTA